jgi:hypothetical protein
VNEIFQTRYLVIITTSQKRDKDHPTLREVHQLIYGACSIHLDILIFVPQLRTKSHSAVQTKEMRRQKNLLADDSEGTEQECVNIIGKHSIDGAGPIEAC